MGREGRRELQVARRRRDGGPAVGVADAKGSRDTTLNEIRSWFGTNGVQFRLCC